MEEEAVDLGISQQPSTGSASSTDRAGSTGIST
jgi:hypothetical protein